MKHRVIFPDPDYWTHRKDTTVTTPEPPAYYDLNLPVDTITYPLNSVNIAVSLVGDHLVGQLICRTDDGAHQFLMGGETFGSLLDQAVRFAKMHDNPEALAATINTLRNKGGLE
jgi:hypothetical protein